ncbi:MAG: hypothetical protein RR358_05910 [Cetobacterium sp.]
MNDDKLLRAVRMLTGKEISQNMLDATKEATRPKTIQELLVDPFAISYCCHKPPIEIIPRVLQPLVKKYLDLGKTTVTIALEEILEEIAKHKNTHHYDQFIDYLIKHRCGSLVFTF